MSPAPLSGAGRHDFGLGPSLIHGRAMLLKDPPEVGSFIPYASPVSCHLPGTI